LFQESIRLSRIPWIVGHAEQQLTLENIDLIEKKEEIKKLEASPENGGEKRIDTAMEPLGIHIQMGLVLDQRIIRECKNADEVVVYILDVIFRSHAELKPLAEQVRHKALGTPKLIIPSMKLPR
jgi:hypothetical protein